MVDFGFYSAILGIKNLKNQNFQAKKIEKVRIFSKNFRFFFFFLSLLVKTNFFCNWPVLLWFPILPKFYFVVQKFLSQHAEKKHQFEKIFVFFFRLLTEHSVALAQKPAIVNWEHSFFVSMVAWYSTFPVFSTISVTIASSCSFKSMKIVKGDFDLVKLDLWLSGPVIVPPTSNIVVNWERNVKAVCDKGIKNQSFNWVD